jgi:hypothetical protein
MQLASHPIAPDLGAESDVVAFDKDDFSFHLKAGIRLINSIPNYVFFQRTPSKLETINESFKENT